MARFDGRVALVTGGASGLGRAIVARLVSEGAQVVSLDRDAERGAAVAAELGAEFRPGDVTREADIVAAVEYAVSLTGRLDILCNNAGMQLIAPLHETTNEQWDLVHAVNVRSTFWGCKHALGPMRAARSGAIVNTASISSFMGDPLLPAYTATKHAILGLTRSVGVHYAAEGIRCNCVCPGDMQTPMIERYWEATGDVEKAKEEMASMYPAKKIGQPAEVANAILFLASDEASYVNASFLQIDGGLLSKVY